LDFYYRSVSKKVSLYEFKIFPNWIFIVEIILYVSLNCGLLTKDLFFDIKQQNENVRKKFYK